MAVRVCLLDEDEWVGRPELISARIHLAPMTVGHLPLLIKLDGDAQVMRFITGRARSAEEVRVYWEPICVDTDADSVGLGWWVGWRRADGEFLGWWDLSPDRPACEGPSTAEAGWRLARQHWGLGYATEGAETILEHGFTTAGLVAVHAETMAVNLASRTVMTKLGMRHLRTEHRHWDDPLPGTEHGEVVYEITRADWDRTREHLSS